MKRICILFLLCCTLLPGIKAQDMATLFANMPDLYIPQLENAWRKDLIDLYNAGKEARLQNAMTGQSTLRKLTADYILVQTTERSTLEMKLLPLVNNTHIICMVATVHGPVADSSVSFFSTDWETLPAGDLLDPVSSDWFIKADANKSSDAYLDATSRLDMHLVKYELSPDNNTLSATYTTPLYLSREDRDKVTPFLKEEPRVYTWERSRFN